MATTPTATPSTAEGDPRVVRSRARVLEAATELLVEGGPWGVTVDAVVARSGVAKSTIYRHWTSRDDLLVDLLACSVPQFPEPPEGATAREALLGLVHALVAAMRDPATGAVIPMLLMLKGQLGGVADLEARTHGHQMHALTTILERGVESGEIRAGIDPEHAVALLVGPLIFVHLTGLIAADEALADEVVDSFLSSHGPDTR